jgi:hypothetical protein
MPLQRVISKLCGAILAISTRMLIAVIEAN